MKVIEVVEIDQHIFLLLSSKVQESTAVVHVQPDLRFTWSYMDKPCGPTQFSGIAKYLRGPSNRASVLSENEIELEIESLLRESINTGLSLRSSNEA